MKSYTNLFICLTIAMFAIGCSPKLNIWETPQYLVTGYDFTEYSGKGFLFTPEAYVGEYQSMGLVDIVYVPSVHIQTAFNVNAPGTYRITVAETSYRVSEADSKDIIRALYDIADELGADAISRFDIRSHTIDNNGTPIPTIRVSGFAIKRL
jgi:uncharacterized protein YbjQ (UPF0145 family)